MAIATRAENMPWKTLWTRNGPRMKAFVAPTSFMVWMEKRFEKTLRRMVLLMRTKEMKRRRVAIAGVLAMKPEVLILDEPTAGLDPKGRDEILDQIAKLREETGMTVILVSHSMEDVAKYVDRIIVMNKSRVMFDDEPKKVFRHYKELEEVGLAAPQITYIMQTLKAKGLAVDTDITGVEEARDAILKAIRG